MIASAHSPSQAGVDVVVEIAQDYGWRLLARGKLRLRVVRRPRLLEYLLGALDGQRVLPPASTWDRAKRCLLSSATARALASALLRCHEACNDVWHDMRSQRCQSGCVPSRSLLPLVCSRVRYYGAGMGAPVCLYPALWVMPRVRRQGVAQRQVGAATLWTIVIERVEGDPT